MITKILIDKNTYDDWSVISPFNGYTTSGGFLISNISDCTHTGYVNIPGVLVAMGSINRAVDIFSGGSFETETTFTGVGGVAKTGDWNFTLENISGNITPLALIGRNVTVIIESTTVFVGKIYNCDPSFENIKFTVRSNFLLWDKEIGTIVESEIENSNNKIIPIIYGDFTGTGDYIPLITDLTEDYTIKGYTSEQELKEITNIFIWDADRLIADSSTNGLDSLSINFDKTEIIVQKETDLHLVKDITSAVPDFDIIYLNKCPTIGIQFTTTPSFTVDDICVSGTNYYKYIEKVGDTYKFIAVKAIEYIEQFKNPANGLYETLKPSTDVDGFFNVFTSTFYTVSASSDVLIPEFFTKQLDYDIRATHIDSFAGYNLGLKYDTENPVNSQIIQIDDEKMLIYETLPVFIIDEGNLFCSRHEVIRGFNNTSKNTHTYTSKIYFKQSETNDIERILKMKTVIPITGISNWRALVAAEGETTGIVYNIPKAIREVVDYVTNFNLIVNNFHYQSRNEISEHLTIQLKNLKNLNYEPYIPEEEEIENAVLTILLDLNLDQTTDIVGQITGIWLLGSFAVDYPATTAGTFPSPIPFLQKGMAIGMRTSDEDTQDFKRVGVNLWHAYKMKLISKEERINTNFTMHTNWWDVIDFLSLTELVNWDRCVPGETPSEDTVFDKYSNNPPNRPNCWEKSYPLSGVWEITTSGGISYKYTNGTIDNPKLPQTLEDFLKQKFVLQLYGLCSSDTEKTSFMLNNVGFLVEYTIDVTNTTLYFQGKGRIDFEENLITNPALVIKDILEDELNLTDIDTVSFGLSLANTTNQTCAFVIYDKVIKSSSLLSTICKEHALILGELPDGKIACFPLGVTGTPVTLYNSDILLNDDRPAFTEGIISIENLLTNLITKYKKRYTDDIYLKQDENTDYAEAYNYLGRIKKATFESTTIRDETTINTLNSIYLNFYAKPIRKITINCSPENTMELVPGQWVIFDSDTYVKNSDGKNYLIIETNLQPGYNDTNPNVELTLLEIEDVSAGEPPEEIVTGLILQDTDEIIEYQM